MRGSKTRQVLPLIQVNSMSCCIFLQPPTLSLYSLDYFYHGALTIFQPSLLERQMLQNPLQGKSSMLNQVDIYTDGACRGNPGPGGWAAILRYQDNETLINGAEADTTNNRMELQAAISALQNLKHPYAVVLTTDSRYLMDGIQQWLPNWKKNGWKTAAKKPVKNDDLWRQLDKLVEEHHITWKWVKGHSGHVENERVDRLANEAIDNLLL